MSSPIIPTSSTAGAQPVRPAVAARAGASVGGTVTPLEDAVSVDALPSSPPQEVMEQMAGAARIHDQLSAQGRELRFAHDAGSGRTTIEVRDRRGNVLGQLSPSQALAVAAGAPLE